MKTFHDKYERCFMRVISQIEKYRIAKLEEHVHPIFEWEKLHGRIIFAQATISAQNPQVLENLVDYINGRIHKEENEPKIKLYANNKYKNGYDLVIFPDFNSPEEEWLKQTEEIVCSLPRAIESFHMKKP